MTIVVRPEELEPYAEAAAAVRHAIHRRPEIGLDLPVTMRAVVARLREIGVDEIAEGVGGEGVTGVVAVVVGRRPGRTIAFRADADALALNERTGKPWQSELPMRMHACGHDGHVATLLAALHWLCEHRDFAGRFVAVFQPGEEGFAGGRRMIEDGLAERFGIEEFYALHGDAAVELGHVAFHEGYSTANADAFEIRVEGHGGHGSRPHLAKDPIVAACEIVSALQGIVSRNVDPAMTAVVSVCSMRAGDAAATSVIPQTAVMTGTTRTYEPEMQDLVERRMGEIVAGVGAACGVDARLNYRRLYPALYNSPEHTRRARALAAEAIGADRVEEFRRRPGGEDFSFMLNARPGCLFRLGVRDAEHLAGVHNECFDFNDRAIPTGAAVLLTIVLNAMAG